MTDDACPFIPWPRLNLYSVVAFVLIWVFMALMIHCAFENHGMGGTLFFMLMCFSIYRVFVPFGTAKEVAAQRVLLGCPLVHKPVSVDESNEPDSLGAEGEEDPGSEEEY